MIIHVLLTNGKKKEIIDKKYCKCDGLTTFCCLYTQERGNHIMDMNQLNYFISVAQTLNFTEAAKRNGITQPSISHHINELEKQLGARLFLRDRRSVTLTDAGREFLPYAMEIVETAQDAICRVKQTEDGSKGHISIARR